MFVDHIRIFAKAGDGGNGCASLRREKYVPKGGPDGGDGGKGGDIVLEVDPHTDNLRAFFYQPNQRAKDGEHGKGRLKTGKSGKPLVLKVPAGTLIYRVRPPKPVVGDDDLAWDLDQADYQTPAGSDVEAFFERGDDEDLEEVVLVDDPEAEDQALEEELEDSGEESAAENSHDEGRELVADLTKIGQRFVLCQGGAGGKGNVHFKSSTNQTPLETTPGEKGEDGWFYLELRHIADAGLVGFPNAGKSTLLGQLSAAKPKVAAYPFTTLKPMVGVLEFSGYSRATVADIPGLIEGAHENVGLGHEFLRHIMRCKVLLFVVDLAGVDFREPVSDLQTLRKEVKLYDEDLAKRDWVIVGNKIDLPEAQENLKIVKQRFKRVKIFPISAETGEGLGELRAYLKETVGHRPD